MQVLASGEPVRWWASSSRSVRRWRSQGLEDGRKGPRTRPPNALSAEERERLLEVANSPEFQDLSPWQIVPQLADRGIYLASEAWVYRVLREAEQLAHRQRSQPCTHQRPHEKVADAPCQVWSWDITYLRSPVRGVFFYLYLILDIWSRKIVGWTVHDREGDELAAELFLTTCATLNLAPEGLDLHADNGGPMKGATMLATLEKLRVRASFSRPRVSDDNPFSEALFRTIKYRPEFPEGPFASLEDARHWVEGFVHWYNTEHLHSEIAYLTPDDRHFGRDQEILANRHRVYTVARQQNPERWSTSTRNWEPAGTVSLNSRKEGRKSARNDAA